MKDEALKTMMQIDRKYGEKQGKQVMTPKEKHRQNFRNMKVQDLMELEDDDVEYKMFDE